jgi:MYXO-CTERM domain-containing protein
MRRHSPLSLLILAASSLAATTALADINSLKGTKPGDITSPDFEDADTCDNCHGEGYKGDKTYLPTDTWAGTMMGNAARDPVFFAALAVANQDVAGVGTYCLRCHSPIGFVKGNATPSDGSAFDKIDKQGVGCETCHRMSQAPGPDAPYVLSDAQVFYTNGDAAKHGPYADSMSPAHFGTTQDLGLQDSRFCGQCHQVTNPDKHLLDAMGADTGLEFPLDTTYEEWQSSDFSKAGGQGCIDCHMPKKTGMFPVARMVGSPLRQDPRIHALTGGNHWGIQAVMKANPQRATDFPIGFQNALDNTMATLKAAVKLQISGAPTKVDMGAPISVKASIENLTGHKFPTGYAETRRAWLSVVLVDSANKETAIVGVYDAATGELSDAAKTHVYRAEHGQWDGAKAVAESHLALHDSIVSDTRIPPKGFVASPTTTPTKEIDFSDGMGGYRSSDDVMLSGAQSLPGGDYTLSVRVLYQSMTKAYIDFLKTTNTTNTKGTELADVYAQTGEAAPIVIAQVDSKLTIAGGPTTSSSSSTSTSTSTSSGAGGAGGGAAATPTGDTSGCSCSVEGAGDDRWSIALAGLTAAALLRLRRRRSSAAR